jgi:flavin-dependent dehydrogenase
VDNPPKSGGNSPDTSGGPANRRPRPKAFSVGPHAGPTYLVTGDAGGAINPFNGEGIAYAYETGRLAASVLVDALASGDGLALQRYETDLQATYGLYYKVARAFVKIIGRPELMRALVSTGMHSRTLMEWVLRIMANLLRPDELGPAEAAYKAVAMIAKVAPEP